MDTSPGDIAVIPTPPGGEIRAEEVTDQHRIFRCTVAPPQYPHNEGIVVVFPPGTPLSGKMHISHHKRGDDLGLYEPIRLDQIKLDDVNSFGKLRLWSLS